MLQNLSNFYGIRWFDFYSALASNFSAIRKLSFVKKMKKKKKVFVLVHVIPKLWQILMHLYRVLS